MHQAVLVLRPVRRGRGVRAGVVVISQAPPGLKVAQAAAARAYLNLGMNQGVTAMAMLRKGPAANKAVAESGAATQPRGPGLA